MSNNKPINVEVTLEQAGGNFARMLKRFTKKVKKMKILEEARERMYYEKPSKKRKRKKEKSRQVAKKSEAARREKSRIKYK
tara:strand:+ start:77 stop:319 length:243 start_codon:yes stop_codon:yes gene_type:complete